MKAEGIYLLFPLVKVRMVARRTQSLSGGRNSSHLIGAAPVTLFEVAQGSSLIPAPYDKAQASYVICKRAAHPGSGLNQKECRVGRAYSACVYACMYVCMRVRMHAVERRMHASNQRAQRRYGR